MCAASKAIVPPAVGTVLVRPIAPSDAAAWLAFVGGLSPATRFKRAARRLEDLTPEGARSATDPDPAHELALVAEPEGGGELCGVARLILRDGGEAGEFLLVVADRWQRQGIGGRLLAALLDAARRRGVRVVDGAVLATNRGMLEFVQRLGFSVEPLVPGEVALRVVKPLAA
ncbi:MAG: GNAT family N-acetyltransferase [Burkholderiales bacterium]|jgi:acetyltransferase|nr:GNAT family N-acetyltransferase [Burkholderiales bacterium]